MGWKGKQPQVKTDLLREANVYESLLNAVDVLERVVAIKDELDENMQHHAVPEWMKQKLWDVASKSKTVIANIDHAIGSNQHTIQNGTIVTNFEKQQEQLAFYAYLFRANDRKHFALLGPFATRAEALKYSTEHFDKLQSLTTISTNAKTTDVKDNN